MTSTDKRSSHNNFSITLSSNFDSGNLQSATLISAQNWDTEQTPIIKLELTPAAEPFNPQYSTKQSTKAFFHFNIKSSKDIVIYACVRRMSILSIIEGSFQEYYRLCVGTKNSTYQPPQYSKVAPHFMQLVRNGDQYTLQFKYKIQANRKIYFAYHYPYSYQKLCHFLQDLDQMFKHSQQHNEANGLLGGVRGVGIGQSNDIYYRSQLLIESTQGRQISLLTITQIPPSLKKSSPISLPRQSRISKSLFPYYDIEDRPFKFNKPYIMITSRVHPGQTSASYALEGLIRKLIGSSPEAEFLRKTFVFLIIPMINPDGVYNGTYRMDMLGHNLNRFYNSCAPHKHPSIFAISSLLQYHSQDLAAFIDIHSHPQAKGSFMYGNAYTSIEDQVQSQVFAKLLSMNCQSFSYDNCTFSEKNMNSKDINDILSKDGSARVCAYKKMLGGSLGNGVHCFALQLGYHGCPIKKDVNKTEQIYQFKSEYRRSSKQFQINDYLQTGEDALNTLTQVYVQTFRAYINSPDSSNIQQNEQNLVQILNCPLQNLRQEIGKEVYDKDERFRIMDSGLLKKIKNIQSVIFGSFYSKIIKKYPQTLQYVKQFDCKKTKKQVPKLHKHSVSDTTNSNIKLVQSLQLSKNPLQLDYKKQIFQNQQELKILRDKLPPRDLKNIIFKSNKQKVNIIPVQFHIPNSKNSSEPKNSRRVSYNRIFDMHADSLPRIEKKKFNLLAQRHRLRQRRIQSSINSNPIAANCLIHEPIILPVSRGGLERKMYNHKSIHDKNTIDSNIEEILDYENVLNNLHLEDQEQYEKVFMQAAVEYQQSFNPELNNNLNILRNQAMFQRQLAHKETTRKLQRNHQTQRLTRRLQTNQQRKRSKSKEKISSAHIAPSYAGYNSTPNPTNQLIQAAGTQQGSINSYNISFNPKALPKLGSKTEKVRNKFDLELKMKEKYDKQYKIENNYKIQAKDANRN